MTLIVLLGFCSMAGMLFLYVLLVTFIMWMVVDAAKQDKFWWMVLIVGVPIIGATVYYFTEKKGDYAKVPPVTHEHKTE